MCRREIERKAWRVVWRVHAGRIMADWKFSLVITPLMMIRNACAERRLRQIAGSGIYGSSRTLVYTATITDLPDRDLASFALDPGRAKLYVSKFIGPNDGRSSSRLLDALES